MGAPELLHIPDCRCIINWNSNKEKSKVRQSRHSRKYKNRKQQNRQSFFISFVSSHNSLTLYIKNRKNNKPGSVRKAKPCDNHLSKLQITLQLQRPTRSINPGNESCCSALLQMRFSILFLFPEIWWALTPPFHPYLRNKFRRRYIFCGTICQYSDYTITYAITEYCPVITRHFFRWSPDFRSLP